MPALKARRLVLIIALVAALAFFAGYLANQGGEVPTAATTDAELIDEHAEHGLEASEDEAGDIIWTCSMHPQIQLPEPGQCPICFMDLIPLERESDTGRASYREITLTDRARKLAEISVEPVKRLDIAVATRMVGKVDYDEGRIKSITAWTAGRVDRMYVDHTGAMVKRGQALVSIYSPELLTAQAELAQAIKARRELAGSSLELVKKTAERTEKAVREKLRLLGLTRGQIDRLASGGQPSDHVTLVSPMAGVVIGKEVVEGQYVQTGTRLYAVADLSRLWVVLEAYESDLPWIEVGGKVDFFTEAFPGKTFSGEVIYIDPLVNEKSRTVEVRLEVDNSSGSLKPGMLVRAVQKRAETNIEADAQSPLVIPESAPLITGTRAVVYVADPKRDGVYEGREVVLGSKAEGYYIVRSGLSEGELVVTKGNFKIDSAVQIVARPSMMNPAHAVHEAQAPLPTLFLSKLRLLDESFRALAPLVAEGDLDKSHLAFGTFHKELRMVDGSGLEGDAAMAWKELSMLLSNDSMLASEAPDRKRLERVFAEMRGHWDILTATFPMQAEAAAQVQAPLAFQQQLGRAFLAYEPLSEALADDDMATAQSAAAALAAALEQVDMTLLDGPAHNVWMQALTTMNDGLEAIRDAPDIASVRVGFEPVSMGMVQAVTTLGVEMPGEVYELMCPMAFENKGATWLQRDEDVRNPYFGEMMLKCGEVTRQIR